MKRILLFVTLLIGLAAYAQSIKVVSGNYDVFKDIPKVDVVLNLDNAKFQVENYSEKEYTEKIMGTIKANPKKSAADVDAWSSNWKAHREQGFADAFIKGANSKSGEKVQFGKNTGAPYQLLVDTQWIYAGWYGGMMMQPAKLSLNMKLVPTGDPTKILLEMNTHMLEGIASNKDLVWEYGRIAGAYEGVGKLLSKEIKKLK